MGKPNARVRRGLRLRGYDYTQAGAYFVTLCTQGRQCLFGHVIGGDMRLNALGAIVAEEWRKTAEIRQEVMLDAFVVMPNHVHAVVLIVGAYGVAGAHGGPPVGAHGRAPLHLYRPPRSLGALIAGLKSATTRRINEHRGTPSARVWQRNYYEHVIRGQEDLHRIRGYIADNPGAWSIDRENPAAAPR